MLLNIGDRAPSFELLDQNGASHSLEEYKGKKLILYFYPKDNTPGCSAQAKGFAELKEQFEQKNAVVVGISKDSVSSHKKFEENIGINFTILSDQELKAINAYGVWQEKKLYGKAYMGVARTSYLIDENGIIEGVVSKPKTKDNPKQMLEML